MTDHADDSLQDTLNWFSADALLSESVLTPNMAFSTLNGRIRSIKPISELTPKENERRTHFGNHVIMPGTVNSHNHSFQSLLKGICDDADFFTWRDQALYKYSRIMSIEDIYNGALFAFSEMLKAGITTVCDFFYINDQANENANAVIKAALDCGIRITMARTMYDWDGAPERFQETPQQAVENTRALFSEYQDHPLVSVLPAPHSLHGASTEMIQAGSALAEELGTPFHMHIAEGEYERNMILERHGQTPIAWLKTLGALNERLVGIHCVWLDDADIALMAEAGTSLSYNPSSNMFLGDGITRIREMIDAGICISLGTDGGCSNNRASIFEEMRMVNLLQKVRFCDATQSQAEEAFLMGTVHGGRNLGLPLGSLQPGFQADFVVLNRNDLSLQPRPFLPKHVVYAMQPSAITAVYVHGHCMVNNGVLTRAPEEEIVARVQETMTRWGVLAAC